MSVGISDGSMYPNIDMSFRCRYKTHHRCRRRTEYTNDRCAGISWVYRNIDLAASVWRAA